MKMFRLACILFISVLVTTTILSGTFAKYTTSMTSNNSARVAKWGVEVEMYGNLFGEAYDGVFDTITNKEDNSVTVKTIQKTTVNDLGSPGTKVVDGLHFSISGSTESAIQIDYRIVNQNVALRPNLYGIMEKIGDISEEDYNNLLKQGKSLYKKVDRLLTGSEPNNTNIEKPGYVKATREDAINNIDIFELYNIVEVNHPTNTNANYPYCPVVFELQSSNSGSLKGYYNGGQVSPMTGSSRYWIYRNEKTLDVLSAAIENQFTNTLEWPVANKENDWKFIREGFQTYNANTDLSSLHLVDEQLTWSWRFEQYADNANPYARLFEDGAINPDQVKGYNAADTILSTLAGKKLDSTRESKKYDNIEVVIHNRSLKFTTLNQVVFSAYKSNTGFNITKDALGNWNDLADEWIVPNEYEDYCLDVDFELEFRITQLD